MTNRRGTHSVNLFGKLFYTKSINLLSKERIGYNQRNVLLQLNLSVPIDHAAMYQALFLQANLVHLYLNGCSAGIVQRSKEQRLEC